MIHHVSVGTSDIKRSRAFYDPVLKTLGLRLLSADDESADYGTAAVLFSVETPVDGRSASAGNGVHVAFRADHRKTVHEFHQVGLANGGTDGGAPGLRPAYDANYFGAFLFDPDGNKIEAVTFSAD
jgi:catechol 2,3-dioxygenase-like lactoylglutathione lyase family enzyme